MRSWPCQYADARGSRCESNALYRLHFSRDHAFDHMDLCDNHLEEYILCAKQYQYFLPNGSLSEMLRKENMG